LVYAECRSVVSRMDQSFVFLGGDGSPVSIADHPKVAAPLDSDLICWLTTVSPAGQPQSSAIWFLREGNSLLMYSAADATRLGNLAHNDLISLNLRGDTAGDFILTLEGTATLAPDVAAAQYNEAYLAKYSAEFRRLGWTPASYSADFSLPVRVEVTRVRYWQTTAGA